MDWPNLPEGWADDPDVRAVRTDAGNHHRALERDGRLPMWVVFGPNTTDHPGRYLARLWANLPKAECTIVLIRAGSLLEVRSLLPDGLTRLARSPADDANVIESWI